MGDVPRADGVAEKGAELAFIGLGIDADFDVRLNVYLKARTEMVAPLRYIEGS